MTETLRATELLTDGYTLEEAHANVRDAFEAVVELYAEQGRPLPSCVASNVKFR